MDVLALDLSKRSTGFARHASGDAKPRHGVWQLGGQFTGMGDVFLKVHRCLADECVFGKPDLIAYEEPLLLGPAAGNTTADTQKLLIGLAMHVESFCAAKNIPCRPISLAQWRRWFTPELQKPHIKNDLGVTIKNPSYDPKGDVIRRCKQLGLAPESDNDADALGILSYARALEKVVMPWMEGR